MIQDHRFICICRFHHLYDYIEKAQKAYQFRHAIEQEAQTLKNEHHGNTNITPTVMLAQTNHQYHAPIGMQATTGYGMKAQTSPVEVRAQIHNNYLPPTRIQAQTSPAEVRPQISSDVLGPTRIQGKTSSAEVQSQINPDVFEPTRMHVQTTRAGTLAKATQNYSEPKEEKTLTSHSYRAPKGQQPQTSRPTTQGGAQTGNSPLPTSPKSWIPNQTSGAQFKTLPPTPFTITQASASHRQQIQDNSQGRSNAPITGNFQSTTKPSVTLVWKAWNQTTTSSQYPSSPVNSHGQISTPRKIPGKAFVPVVASPVPEKQHNHPTMASLKPPTVQNWSSLKRTSPPSTVVPLPGNNYIKTPSFKSEIPGTNISPEMKIPLFDKTYLPVGPRVFPGKNKFQNSINTNNQNAISQRTITNTSFVAQQQHFTDSPAARDQSLVIGNPVKHVQQQLASANPSTAKHFITNKFVTQQQTASSSPFTQQQFTTNKPLTQQHFTLNKPVTQQHFTMNKPVTQQHVTLGPVTQQTRLNSIGQQHFSMTKPVTLQQTANGNPVTQQQAITDNHVLQQQTVTGNSDTQSRFAMNMQHQPVSGNNVMQQYLPSKPVTQQFTMQQPNRQESKNILQLLSNGLNKDLKNLDIRAHLRPYRDARDARRNITKFNNTASTFKTESQRTTVTNISNSGISDQSFELDKTSENKTENSASDEDLSDHIQPIVISSTSVLDSIASMFAKKKMQGNKATGSHVQQNNLRKWPKDSNDSFLRTNITNSSPKVIDRFQTWLKDKATGPNIIDNGTTSNIQRIGAVNNITVYNMTTDTANAQDSAKLNPNSDPTTIYNSISLANNPLTSSPSRVIENNAPNSDSTKITSKRLTKEHLFYFPVKKNTLVDLFREKGEHGQ